MPIAGLWPLPPPAPQPTPQPTLPDTIGEDDFLGALQAKLPRGRAWPLDPDSLLTAFLRGVAKAYARIYQRSANLLLDAFPSLTVELLPEWEATLGLPDPCIGPQPLISERRAQVLSRIENFGGQSIDYFIKLAATLGFPITITEFAPYRFGDPLGLPMLGEAWAHAWQVNAPTFSIHYFLFGTDQFGDPFADWGGAALQCEIRRFAPGQTVVLFTYAP